MLLKPAQTLKIGLKTTTSDSYPYLYKKNWVSLSLSLSNFDLLELYNPDKDRSP